MNLCLASRAGSLICICLTLASSHLPREELSSQRQRDNDMGFREFEEARGRQEG